MDFSCWSHREVSLQLLRRRPGRILTAARLHGLDISNGSRMSPALDAGADDDTAGQRLERGLPPPHQTEHRADVASDRLLEREVSPAARR
jgi:hypothetical protein